MNNTEKIYQFLEIAGIIKNDKPGFPSKNNFELGLSLILEELSELAESGSKSSVWKFIEMLEQNAESLKQKVRYIQEDNSNFTEFRDAIADLKVVVDNQTYFSGMSSEQSNQDLENVMKSNMSKFCKTKEEAEQTCLAYLEGTHPNKKGQVIKTKYNKVGDYYVITKVSDNKIMKSINYKEVFFQKI